MQFANGSKLMSFWGGNTITPIFSGPPPQTKNKTNKQKTLDVYLTCSHVMLAYIIIIIITLLTLIEAPTVLAILEFCQPSPLLDKKVEAYGTIA